MFQLPSLLFVLIPVAQAAPPTACGIDDHCAITGSSSGRASHTYSIRCGDEKIPIQMEYLEGSSSAEIVDVITHEPKEKCSVDKSRISKLIQTFNEQKHAIENPKCFLSHWKGQVTFHSGGEVGRCSLRMNKDLSEKFEKSVGLNPSYQCEKEYFLIGPQPDGTAIYRRSGKGWELECKAPMQKDPPENIDWKNPPQYYEPEGPLVLPKTSAPF